MSSFFNFIEVFFKSKINQILFFSVLSLLFLLLALIFNVGMFWDNILFTTKIGKHLLNTNIFNWMLPDQLDAGHPPTFGFLLVIFWEIFGYSLNTSYLLMFFFKIGLFYQLFHFIYYFLKSYSLTFFAFILIIVDPSLSAQSILVSPEIIQIFLVLLAINAILKNKSTLKVIALFFLSIMSLRGLLLFGGIFLFDFINQFNNKEIKKSFLNKKLIIEYCIGILPAFMYLSAHYYFKGWLLSHTNSPWASQRNFVSFYEFLRNCVIVAHRYLDFGRIFIFLFIVFTFFLFGKKIFLPKKHKQLILISITSVFFVIVVSLFATNPITHRYLMVAFIPITLLSFSLIVTFFNKKKKIIYLLLVTGLITGNLWIYPKHISQGWDATLAHLPYHSLRLKAIDFLNKKKINIEDVASFFPNYTTLDLIDFSGDQRSFLKYTGVEKYVFYSNIYNLEDEDLKSLENNYNILKEFNNFNINITIYILKK